MLIRIFVVFLFTSAGAAVAQDTYHPGQLGSYINLCNGGRSGAMCQMYLAGYRAALYDYNRQLQEIDDIKRKNCKDELSSSENSFCTVDSNQLVLPMFEGCNGEGFRLPANVVHQVLMNYAKDHPESLKDTFPAAYKAAMDSSFPCK